MTSYEWRKICINTLLGAAAVFASSIAVYSVIFVILTAGRVLATLMGR